MAVGARFAAFEAAAPVILAVAISVTAADMDAACAAVLTDISCVIAVSAGPLAVAGAAVRIAARSSCWGAGEAAARPMMAAADSRELTDRMLGYRSVVAGLI